ncbi:MAG: ImmA/IrrE family metallo-endopeptidase [Symbiobacteriia bacterium]
MTLTAKQTQLIAFRQAVGALRHYGVDDDRPVDVLAVLRNAGIVVMRQPLGNLAGAYIPTPTRSSAPPGIILNSSHPLARQRYTAAHEFCHHLRDRTAAFDTYDSTNRRDNIGPTDRERIAEAFASWFLMPRSLVASALKKVESPPRTMEETVLALSQYLGVSYTAAIMHLYTLRHLNMAEVTRLRRAKPSVIKQSMGGKLGSTTWNDTWVLNLNYHGATLHMREGDEVQVVVPESPSTGHEWAGAQGAIAAAFEISDLDAIGALGLRRFVFPLRQAGSAQIHLREVQSWEPSSISGRLNIDISVSKRVGVDERVLTK